MSELDEEVDRLRAQAEQALAAERQRIERAKQARVMQKPSKTPAALGDSDSFGEWFRIVCWPLNGPLGAVASAAWLAVLIMSFSALDDVAEPNPLVRGLLIADLALLPAAFFVFLRQRTWRKRLSFELTGWSTVVAPQHDGSSSLARDYWRRTSVRVLTSGNEVGIDAALTVFALATRDAFYRPSEDEERTHWTSNGLTAEGDANNRVIAELRALVLQLDRLNRLGAGMTQVSVLGSSGRYVSAWTSDA